MMFETIKRLFFAGKLSEKGIIAAVTRGWITQEQADSLLATLEDTDITQNSDKTSQESA